MNAVATLLDEAAVRYRLEDDADTLDFAVRLLDTGQKVGFQYEPGLAPKQLPYVVQRLHAQIEDDAQLAIIVRQLTWSLLEACKKADVAIFDLHGNAYIRLPGLYIERIRRSRKERNRPTSGSVFTAKATRVLRALLSAYPHDRKRAELVRETGLSAGYVSVLVKRLINDGYVSDRLDLLYLDDPERLLDDWLAHYRFDRHKKHVYAMTANTYDQGIERLSNQLQASGVRFAFTGWAGAHLRAPYATPSVYTAYVAEPPGEMAAVFPVEGQGNVALYVPQDEGVFQFASESDLGDVVSDAQLYLDLCRMPGRAKEQADALRQVRLNFASMVR